MPDYQTPRMLGAAMRALRTHRKVVDKKTGKKSARTQATVARAFRKDHSIISKTEDRKINIDYPMLHMYQCYFGVPNGILLCISHIAAITRDIATTKGKRRNIERERLDLFAHYLRNLADRIQLPVDGKASLKDYPLLKADDEKSWRLLLFDLFAATQKDKDMDAATVFEDLIQLNTIAIARREGNGADMNGAATPSSPRKRSNGAARSPASKSMSRRPSEP